MQQRKNYKGAAKPHTWGADTRDLIATEFFACFACWVPNMI